MDQRIFREQNKAENVALAWIDDSMAYDKIPQIWIIECLKMLKISVNVKQRKLESGMTNAEVKIQRGIFLGNSLTPQLFFIVMIPLNDIWQMWVMW